MKTLFLLLVFFPAIAIADDIKTTKGVEYKNATITRAEPDGLMIMYSAGIVKIPFEELPKDLQVKYHYDPAEGAKFRSQLEAAAARRDEEIMAAKARLRAANSSPLQPLQVAAAPGAVTQPRAFARATAAPDPRKRFSEVLPSDNLQSVPELTLAQYEDQKLMLVGKIIRLRFETRSTDPREGRDGKTYRAELHDQTTSEVQICFPSEELGWFTRIVPYFDRDSKRTPIRDSVYGKIRKDEYRSIVLDLLGNEIFTDFNSKKIIWR